jgi:K+-sensing histidine kinase KdpD
MATAQAALRITVAGVAQTLARRSQNLISRQLTLITELEKQHAEPTTLERLFELDHLAVRVRRLGDTMLVLSGAGPGWRWPRPATLTDVVKAATAATEQYQRVEVAALPAVDVVAPAIVDLMLILTELIDNAARFSHPEQPVSITAGRLADGGVRIEVRDGGHGLGTRTAATLNARLARPAVAGIGDEQTLGLYVVSVLAARTGTVVTLVPVEHGCVATVVIPAKLLAAATPAGAGEVKAEQPVGVPG